jgi:hypothetical protein
MTDKEAFDIVTTARDVMRSRETSPQTVDALSHLLELVKPHLKVEKTGIHWIDEYNQYEPVRNKDAEGTEVSNDLLSAVPHTDDLEGR